MTKRLSRQASPPSPERRARSRTRTDNGAAMTEPQDVEFPADKRTIVPDDLIVWGREQQEARAAAAKATFKTVAQLAAEKKERDAAIAAAKAAGLPPPFGQPLKGFAPSFAKPKAPPKGKERAGGAGKGGVKGTGVPAKGAGATATAPVGKIGQQHPNMSSLGGTKGGRAPADPRQPQQPAKIAKNEVAGGTVPKQPAAAAVASSAFLPAKEATASAQVLAPRAAAVAPRTITLKRRKEEDEAPPQASSLARMITLGKRRKEDGLHEDEERDSKIRKTPLSTQNSTQKTDAAAASSARLPAKEATVQVLAPRAAAVLAPPPRMITLGKSNTFSRGGTNGADPRQRQRPAKTAKKSRKNDFPGTFFFGATGDLVEITVQASSSSGSDDRGPTLDDWKRALATHSGHAPRWVDIVEEPLDAEDASACGIVTEQRFQENGGLNFETAEYRVIIRGFEVFARVVVRRARELTRAGNWRPRGHKLVIATKVGADEETLDAVLREQLDGEFYSRVFATDAEFYRVLWARYESDREWWLRFLQTLCKPLRVAQNAGARTFQVAPALLGLLPIVLESGENAPEQRQQPDPAREVLAVAPRSPRLDDNIMAPPALAHFLWSDPGLKAALLQALMALLSGPDRFPGPDRSREVFLPDLCPSLLHPDRPQTYQIWDDPDFVQVVLQLSPRHLDEGLISERLRFDKAFVLEAVRRDARVLEFVPVEFRDCREVLLEALRTSGPFLPFRWASVRLKTEIRAAAAAWTGERSGEVLAAGAHALSGAERCSLLSGEK